MSPELMIWFAVAIFIAAIAIVFLSIATYFWLADYFEPASAAAIVGAALALIAGTAIARCIVLRRRTTALALAKLRAAEQRAPWWSDPAVIAIGYEVAKKIGWRKLTPLVAAGVLAAATLGRKSGERRASNGSADDSHPTN